MSPQHPLAAHTVEALHRAVDRVCDGWGRLQFENPPDSMVGTSWGGGRSRGCGPADPTGAAVLRHSRAHAWLAELHDVVIALTSAAKIKVTVWEIEPVRRTLHAAIDDLIGKYGWGIDDLIDLDPQSCNYRRDVFGLERLADRFGEWFPTEPGGASRPVGDPETEDCGLCKMPAPGGRNRDGQLLVRRIDGQAFHAVAGYGHGACWWTVWRQRRGTAA